jgi:hypothetical protein
MRGRDTDDLSVVWNTLPNILEWTDTAVENGTTYLYGVRAFTMVNESVLAGPLNATPYGPPGIPMNPEVTPGDGQVFLEWSTPANNGGRPLAGYRIYAGASPGGLTLKSTTAVVMSHYLSGLVNGEEVFVAVTAVNEMGEGPMTAPISVTPFGLPSKPRDLTLTIGPEGVLLRWAIPARLGGAGSLSYRIERGPSAAALTTLEMIDSVTEHLDVTVQKGSVYYYRVLALNPLGSPGEPSETLVATIPGLPGPVAGFTVRPGDGLIRISWVSPIDDGGAPVLNYTIYRAVGGNGLLRYAVVVGNTSFTDTDVINSQMYQYTVCAVNLMGMGPQSTPISVTPMDRPSAPWDLVGTVEGTTVKLKWSAPMGQGATVTGYIVYRGADPDKLAPIAELGDVREYTDGDVEKGRTYYYRVAANSTVGEGDQSQMIKVPVGTGIRTLLLLVVVLLVAIIASLIALMRWRHAHSKPPK